MAASDTGDWSTYSYRGRESTPGYHELLRELLSSLGDRVRTPVYCDAATTFRRYQSEPAQLVSLGPAGVVEGRPAQVRFFVSKLSAVQLTITRDGRKALEKVVTFRRGNGSFAWTPKAAGSYSIRLAAKELRTGRGLRAQVLGRIESLPGSGHPASCAGRIPFAPVVARTILYTGKGGVGKTSVAAATARRCAAAGLRTLVMSTDPAHSLSDCVDTQLSSIATPIAPNLAGQEVQAQEEIERHWQAVSGWLGQLLAEQGVDRISAEELTVPPGTNELFSLLQVKQHHESGEFDVLVVDCAPTGETLRLLSFPDVCTWWLEKVFPWQGKWLAAARPFARNVLDVPLPPDGVLADVERLVRNMVAMNAILRDPTLTTVRLVMTPDRMVVREAMRTFTYLNLYGYLTDAVVVNRIFPEATGDTYFSEWREAQREQMEAVRSAFAPVPILTAPYLPREVMGETMLDGLADEIFGDLAADAVLHKVVTQELTTGEGRATLRLLLPFAERGDVELKKIGLEVIVKVAGQKRTIILPPAMAAYETSGARLENGALEVAFERATDGATAQHTS